MHAPVTLHVGAADFCRLNLPRCFSHARNSIFAQTREILKARYSVASGIFRTDNYKALAQVGTFFKLLKSRPLGSRVQYHRRFYRRGVKRITTTHWTRAGEKKSVVGTVGNHYHPGYVSLGLPNFDDWIKGRAKIIHCYLSTFAPSRRFSVSRSLIWPLKDHITPWWVQSDK